MERTHSPDRERISMPVGEGVLRHIEEYQVKFVAVTTVYSSIQQYNNLRTTSYQNNYEHLWSKRYHSRNVTQSQTIRGVKMDPPNHFLTVSRGVSCFVQGVQPL